MVWALLLWAVPGEAADARSRLEEAIRETRPLEARAALDELSAAGGARAAKAILSSLPRARDKMAQLCAATVQARLEYDRIDSDFSFNPFDDRLKQKQLSEMLALIKDVSRKAVDAELVYDAIRQAIPGLGPEGAEVIAAEAERTPSWLLKCELLEGLGAAGVRAPLLRVLDRREPTAVLATALAGVASERAAAYLTHPQWQVRLAALRGLKGARGAAGTVVDRMSDPDGRFRREAALALRDLTDTNLPADPGAWQDWWKANSEDFLTGRYNPQRPKELPGPGRTTFYEIPIY